MNPLLSTMSPTATRMIRMDHSHAMTQFHKLEAGQSRAAREATVRTLCTALDIHLQLEDEIFYPALRTAGAGLDAVERGLHEHDEMRALIARVRSLAADDPSLADTTRQLMRLVLHHVAEEETQLLPLAEQRLGGQLAELGARMTERRHELATPNIAQRAADIARASPAKTAIAVAGTVAVGALRHKDKHQA